MTPARRKALRQYVVLHLKVIEMLHLFQLSRELPRGRPFPDSVLEHSSERFKETLISMIVTVFMSIANESRNETYAKTIWQAIYPRYARSIGRIWTKQISPGVEIMKHYRDKAGAHSDKVEEYFEAKLRLIREKKQMVDSLEAFLRLSIRLMEKQITENPHFESEIESVLFDLELARSEGSFNREWLRQMRLIPRGPYTKRFN